MKLITLIFIVMIGLLSCKPCYKPIISDGLQNSTATHCQFELKLTLSHWQYCKKSKIFRIHGISQNTFLQGLSSSCLVSMNITDIQSILGNPSEKTSDILIYNLNSGCNIVTKDGCSALVVQLHDSKVFDLRIQRLDWLK
jgi:hypothetical protein